MRTGAAVDVAQARRAIDDARREERTGSQDVAWQAVRTAAGIARSLGDAELMAEAATIVTEPALHWRTVAARQALCLEGLAMLGPADQHDDSDTRREWRERLGTRLAGLSDGWLGPSDSTVARVDAREAERRFERLQSAHRRSIGPRGLPARLELASETVRLGSASGDDRILAWGWHWRADDLQHLGLRLEFNRAFGAMVAAAERTESMVWAWRVAAARACLALMEDRVDDVPVLAETARELGQRAAASDAALCDLTLRSELARRTGAGLGDVEADVRAFVAEGPLFAQGWRAEVLLAQGRVTEAVTIHRALAPHVGDIPEDVHEWLVVPVTMTGLAIAAEDHDTARILRRALTPHAHLHLASPITTPYGGPVSLPLARLSALLGDAGASHRYARDAVARAEAMNAPWCAAAARELVQDTPTTRARGPLSARESEIAGWLARGSTNREIATQLHLSERTVEQHVRSILQKLGMPNRAAVAAWVARD